MAMKIFELFGSVFVDSDEANKSLSKTDDKAKGLGSTLGKGIKTAAKWSAAFVAGAGVVGGAMLKAGSEFAEATDRVDKLSQRLGLSREGFQEWEFVLSQSGVSIDSMQSGMKTLSQRMGDAVAGTGKGAEIFKQLGINVRDANGEVKTQEQIFNESVKALQNMEDGVEKAAIAQDLFARSGQDLLPLLNANAEATEAMKDQAQELGLVIGDEAIDAGVQFTDTMDQLKRSFSAVTMNLMSGLMPILQQFLEFVMAQMPMTRETLGSVFSTLSSVISSVFPLLMDIIQKALPPLIEAFMMLVQTLLPPLIDLFKLMINTVLPPLLDFFQRLGAAILPPLIAVMETIINQVLPPLIAFFEEIVDKLLPPLIELFVSLAEDVLPPLIDVFNQIIEAVMPLLIEIFNMFTEIVLPPLIELIEVFTNDVLPFLVDAFLFLAENVLPIVMDVFRTMVKVIEPIMHAIADVIGIVINAIKGDWESVWEGIKSFFSNIWDAVMIAAEAMATPFVAIFEGIGEVVTNIFSGIVDAVKNAINFGIDGINSFINMINKIEFNLPGEKYDWSPSIPTIPRLERGGTLRQGGRVMVGERGPELLDLPTGAKVTPLSYAGGSGAMFGPGSFEGMIITDDYGVDQLMDRIVGRMVELGVI